MILISPSILSSDFANLAREVGAIADGGADLAHVDVMDGHFVPNITIGVPVVASLKKVSALPLDVHGEDVGLQDGLAPVKFDRIRRITGYLVGTLDRFNDAKRAEEHDRVKHEVPACCK